MRFIFISNNGASWGGSEELWACAAIALAGDGHRVTVFKKSIDDRQPRIRQLRAAGCRMIDIRRPRWVPRAIASFLSLLANPLMVAQEVLRLALYLRFAHPDLVVVSQGGNHDGRLISDVCRWVGVPYVVIAQKAGDMYWPADRTLARLGLMYSEARECSFVSDANRRLTEEQLGFPLPHATVVRNPFLVPWEKRTDWPDERDGLRLACIGRLFPAEKGQDTLLRVLARDHWRARPLSVTFYGDGPQRNALERMAQMLCLTNVTFAGFVEDVAAIWNDHHALVLPSRCEGLPLVLVEAMLSGRVPITTDVAGHPEVVADGETGFLSRGTTEDAFDAALERAWTRRAEWRAIGENAAERIRTLVPSDPGRVFADRVVQLAEARRGNEDPACPEAPATSEAVPDSTDQPSLVV